MVRWGLSKNLLRNESGAVLVEGMIVLPVVMLMFAAFVEFGYAMFQWNQTVKAAEWGARIAAVSDSVATAAGNAFSPVTAATPSDPTDAGKTIPVAGTGAAAGQVVSSWACGPGTPSAPACDPAGIQRLVYGKAGNTTCQAISSTVRPAMCHLNPRIQAANVRVTYSRSGLGYFGRPQGAVVTVRVEVLNVTFNLPLLGTLLKLNSLTIPSLPATVTSEDLKTAS
jgi:Flp pilus assembly protein TadG